MSELSFDELARLSGLRQINGPPSRVWQFNTPKAAQPWKVVDSDYPGQVLELEEPNGWYLAHVRRDGCVEFSRYFNRPMHDPDGRDEDINELHICAIDDLIARLEAIKVLAREHFKDVESEWETER